MFVFKIFFIFILALPSFASWEYEASYILKKDEILKIAIQYKVKKVNKRNGDFYFRWTLYDPSKQLIIISSYQGFQKQLMMKLNYNLDSFKTKLNPNFAKPWQQSFVKVVFEKFDKKRQEAHFLVFIKDSSNIYNISL